MIIYKIAYVSNGLENESLLVDNWLSVLMCPVLFSHRSLGMCSTATFDVIY